MLIHYLNSILNPRIPICHVDILNPYNEREFLTDKLTIVDVKAKDEEGIVYQLEIQLDIYPHLPERMLYTWANLYKTQLQAGKKFTELAPAISIWMLTGTMFSTDQAYHHQFQAYDQQNKTLLSNHFSIHILELNKWEAKEVLSGEDQWLHFFKDAKHWFELPENMNTAEMRQAMAVLERFSEEERQYHLYQARENAIREELTKQALLDEAYQKLDKALEQKQEALEREQEAERQKQEALQREQETAKREQEIIKQKEKLEQMLKNAGIDPDS